MNNETNETITILEYKILALIRKVYIKDGK